MSDQIKLVNTIFTEFEKTKVLDELVLTGSWCLYVYKRSEEYNYIMQDTSTITTMDIDFTIPDKNKVKTEADVPAILNGIGFTEERMINGYIKFENPNLEMEFLTKLVGREIESIVEIKKLKLNAIPLRYMDILTNNSTKVHFEGLEITVPKPAAFIFNKFFISEKRKKKEKINKDIQTAKELLNTLLVDDEHRENLRTIYKNFPEGWKKRLRNIFLKHEIDVKNFE